MRTKNIIGIDTELFFITQSKVDGDARISLGDSISEKIKSEDNIIVSKKAEDFRKYIESNSFSSYVYITWSHKTADTYIVSNNIVEIKDKTVDEAVSEAKWVLSDFGKIRKHSGQNTWFISDMHLNHRNIIKYCSRPWNSGTDDNGEIIVTDENLNKMTEDIISRWNSIVGKDDIVWNLGDFVLGPNQNTTIPNIVSRLNGKMNLVLGNHDHHSVKFYYDAGINRVYDRKIIINDFVILSHAPMEFIKGPFFNIYGHVHDCSTYKTWSKNSCCVCVERHDYKPVSWEEIQKHYDELNNEGN